MIQEIAGVWRINSRLSRFDCKRGIDCIHVGSVEILCILTANHFGLCCILVTKMKIYK